MFLWKSIHGLTEDTEASRALSTHIPLFVHLTLQLPDKVHSLQVIIRISKINTQQGMVVQSVISEFSTCMKEAHDIRALCSITLSRTISCVYVINRNKAKYILPNSKIYYKVMVVGTEKYWSRNICTHQQIRSQKQNCVFVTTWFTKVVHKGAKEYIMAK